jgi:hypothetical protein
MREAGTRAPVFPAPGPHADIVRCYGVGPAGAWRAHGGTQDADGTRALNV